MMMNNKVKRVKYLDPDGGRVQIRFFILLQTAAKVKWGRPTCIISWWETAEHVTNGEKDGRSDGQRK